MGDNIALIQLRRRPNSLILANTEGELPGKPKRQKENGLD